MRVQGLRLIVTEEVRNYKKVVFIRTFLKMAGGANASSTPPPPTGSASVLIISNWLTNTVCALHKRVYRIKLTWLSPIVQFPKTVFIYAHFPNTYSSNRKNVEENY